MRDVVTHAPVLGEGEQGAGYGKALAAGDFDGDRFTDLAVGAPFEGNSTGAVHLYRGSEFGLRPWRTLRGTHEAGLFGSALAAGVVYVFAGTTDDGLVAPRHVLSTGPQK